MRTYRRQVTPLIQIPAGTAASQCRGCGKIIYWLTTTAGKRVPVSVNEAFDPRCTRPTRTTWGQGINHFADCRERDRFRRPAAASTHGAR